MHKSDVENNLTAHMMTHFIRGTTYDRNGKTSAGNKAVHDATAIFKEAEEPDISESRRASDAILEPAREKTVEHYRNRRRTGR